MSAVTQNCLTKGCIKTKQIVWLKLMDQFYFMLTSTKTKREGERGDKSNSMQPVFTFAAGNGN